MRSCVVLGCPPGLRAQGPLLFTSPSTVWAVLWSQPPTFNVYCIQTIEKGSAQLLIGDCRIEAEVIKVVMEQCCPGMGLD